MVSRLLSQADEGELEGFLMVVVPGGILTAHVTYGLSENERGFDVKADALTYRLCLWT